MDVSKLYPLDAFLVCGDARLHADHDGCHEQQDRGVEAAGQDGYLTLDFKQTKVSASREYTLWLVGNNNIIRV